MNACNTNWDDLCQLQYTSGTTGKPKGAMLTHGNYFTAIHNECDVLTLKQDDIFLGIYPMAHVGLSWAIAALRAAAYYIMIEQFDLDEYSPQEAMKNCTVPVIFFHGDNDDFVPCEMSKINYDACTAKKRLVMIEGAGHGLAYPVAPERYITELKDFFG